MNAHMILAAAFLMTLIRFWRMVLAVVACVIAAIFVLGLAAGLSLVWH